MTKEEYLKHEAHHMGTPWTVGRLEQLALSALAAAWHSLSPQDQAELDSRPPVEGRPRFVSSTAKLRPTLGFEEAVSGAADDAIEGKDRP